MAPSPQHIEQTLRDWVAAVNTGDYDYLNAMATDDATWWLLGNPERHPNLSFIGTRPYKENVDGLKAHAAAMTADYFRVTLKDIFVSYRGDKAALEVEPYGKSGDGRVYWNTVMFKFVLNEEGKITEVKEYADLDNTEAFFRSP